MPPSLRAPAINRVTEDFPLTPPTAIRHFNSLLARSRRKASRERKIRLRIMALPMATSSRRIFLSSSLFFPSPPQQLPEFIWSIFTWLLLISGEVRYEFNFPKYLYQFHIYFFIYPFVYSFIYSNYLGPLAVSPRARLSKRKKLPERRLPNSPLSTLALKSSAMI